MEGMKMKKRIIFFMFLCVLFCFNPLTAQCTDADSDGYYYEEGCGTERDCNDGNALINPGAIESCNGNDDNCDSNLDEGCDTYCDNPEKYGSDKRITWDYLESLNPNLAWTLFRSIIKLSGTDK